MTRTNPMHSRKILQRAAAILTAVGAGLVVPAGTAWAADPAPAAAPSTKTAKEPQKYKKAIPWSAAVGKPTFQAGRTDGFYVWHDGSQVTIVTTTQTKTNKTFHGRVVVDGGTIGMAGGENLEKNDKIKMPKPHVLEFRLRTDKGADQVSFTVKNGTHLKLDLDEGEIGAKHVYYGKDATQSERPNLIFDLTK